jgi:hypothetical protein
MKKQADHFIKSDFGNCSEKLKTKMFAPFLYDVYFRHFIASYRKSYFECEKLPKQAPQYGICLYLGRSRGCWIRSLTRVILAPFKKMRLTWVSAGTPCG